MYYFIYGFITIVGCVLLALGIKYYIQTKILLNNGITTTATVVRLIRHSGNDGDTFSPVFEYYTPQKEIRNFESEISSSPSFYRVGDQEEIVYDMNDDKNIKTISYWGLYRWTIVLFSIASPFLVIGLGYFVYLLSMKLF